MSNNFWRGATRPALCSALVALEWLTRIKRIAPGKKLGQFAAVSGTDHCGDTTSLNTLCSAT
jgi:hypothetical protein